MVHSGQVCYFPSLAALETAIGYDQTIASLQAALPNHRVQNYFQQKPTLLAEADHLAVAWNSSADGSDGNVVGLITGRNYTTQNTSLAFVHISTLHVAEAQQRGSLLKKLIAAMFVGIWQREGNLPTWTAIKTFNPSVYNALLRMQQMIGDGVVLYPESTGTRSENNMAIEYVAGQIAALLEPNCLFDTATGAIRGGGGSIGGSYWPATPRSSHDEINRFFDERLAATDRMLCVLGLDEKRGKPSTVKLLTRWMASVPSK